MPPSEHLSTKSTRSGRIGPLEIFNQTFTGESNVEYACVYKSGMFALFRSLSHLCAFSLSLVPSFSSFFSPTCFRRDKFVAVACLLFFFNFGILT